MNRSIWNTCRSKIRYRDEHTANHYKKKGERERGIKLDYYWCAYCEGYHLTKREFRPEGYGIKIVWRMDESGEKVLDHVESAHQEETEESLK